MYREKVLIEWQLIRERLLTLDEEQAKALVSGHTFSVVKQTIAALHLAKAASNTTLGDVLQFAGETLNRGKAKTKE